MENLGALAILLAFCFSIYAVIASVVGKWKSNPFLTLERRTRCLLHLLPADGSVRHSGLRADRGRLPAGLRRRALESRHADRLQVRGLVGRTGGLAAAVGLAALALLGDRRLPESPQVPRHDAVDGRDPDVRPGILLC